MKKKVTKIRALYLLLVSVLPFFTVYAKAIPKTVTYFEDLEVNTNVTYNTYTIAPCYGTVGWEDYPVWGYRCHGCGYFEEDPRARNPVPTNVGAAHYYSTLGHKETTKAVSHVSGNLTVTVTDSDHSDEITEATCVYTPADGESSDYTIDWLDSSGKVIGNGDKISITSAGKYTARVNVTVPSGATVTANTATFEVKAGGSYQLPVVFIGANPIEVPNLYRIGIKKIYFGNIQIL